MGTASRRTAVDCGDGEGIRKSSILTARIAETDHGGIKSRPYEICCNVRNVRAFRAMRQRAHILAEKKQERTEHINALPNCHLMFDTHLKPKIFKAMADPPGFPESWKKSIYDQAAKASANALKAKAASPGD